MNRVVEDITIKGKTINDGMDQLRSHKSLTI